MSLKDHKIDIIIVLLLVLTAMLVFSYDINGTGATFDEGAFLRVSLDNTNAILNLDFSQETWSIFKEHPPLFTYIYGLVYKMSPAIRSLSQKQLALIHYGGHLKNVLTGSNYTAGRLLSAFLGALMIAMVYLIGKIFFTRKEGIIASIILILLPNFIAYSKVAYLDAPTAFMFTLCTFLFMLTVKYNTRLLWILTCIASGLAISTRFITVMVFFVYIAIYLMWSGPAMYRERKLNLNIYFILIPFISLLILFLLWPRLWFHPIDNMIATLGHWGPGESGNIEPFMGVMRSNPVYSYVVYFAVTTPVLILILWLTSLWRAVKKPSFWHAAILVWFFIPFLWSFSPQKSDGMRYLFMIYPPLALLAALGVAYLFRSIKWQTVAAIIVFIYLAYISISIHPYYLDYYNELIGGPKAVQANHLFEFDFYGEGIKPAIEWTNKNAKENSIIGIKFNPWHDSFGWRKDFVVLDLMDQNHLKSLTKNLPFPDYFIVNDRYYQYDVSKDIMPIPFKKYKLVFTESVRGAPLTWIYKKVDEEVSNG